MDTGAVVENASLFDINQNRRPCEFYVGWYLKGLPPGINHGAVLWLGLAGVWLGLWFGSCESRRSRRGSRVWSDRARGEPDCACAHGLHGAPGVGHGIRGRGRHHQAAAHRDGR
jgi:hypothetical protein